MTGYFFAMMRGILLVQSPANGKVNGYMDCHNVRSNSDIPGLQYAIEQVQFIEEVAAIREDRLTTSVSKAIKIILMGGYG